MLAQRLFPPEWRRAHPDYLSSIPHPCSLAAFRGFGSQIGAMAAYGGCWSRLPAIACPTLVVTGNEDELVPPVNSRRLAMRIPGARLVLVPLAGHGLMYQYPGRLTAVVDRFLQRVRR